MTNGPVLDYGHPQPPKKRLPLWWCALISLAGALFFSLRTVDPQHPIDGGTIAMFALLFGGVAFLIAATVRAILARFRG